MPVMRTSVSGLVLLLCGLGVSPERSRGAGIAFDDCGWSPRALGRDAQAPEVAGPRRTAVFAPPKPRDVLSVARILAGVAATDRFRFGKSRSSSREFAH